MSNYIGRFAPSPSGALHLGSLMSATCSYLQAKSKQGQWLVRIEDVDTPRIVKGAAYQQLKQLENFGFEWDAPVLYQSSRSKDYNDTLHQLIKNHKIYACECTRKQLKATATASEIGFIYPRNCVNKNLKFANHALRLKTSAAQIKFIDGVYGKQNFNIQQLSSDWIIKRADGIIAYHLAVVVDDAMQGTTEIVRGYDILALTPLHIELQKELKFNTPHYLHHPLIEDNGKKLSKQNQAPTIHYKQKTASLNIILKALGQKEILNSDDLETFWKIAIQQWDKALIPTKSFKSISF